MQHPIPNFTCSGLPLSLHSLYYHLLVIPCSHRLHSPSNSQSPSQVFPARWTQLLGFRRQSLSSALLAELNESLFLEHFWIQRWLLYNTWGHTWPSAPCSPVVGQQQYKVQDKEAGCEQNGLELGQLALFSTDITIYNYLKLRFLPKLLPFTMLN